MFESNLPRVRNQVLALLLNKWGLSSFATLTIQQAFEASSTFWLVLVMKAITTGEPFLHYLLFYLASLVFPYIPWCLAYVLKISWKQEALKAFIHTFVASNKNNIGEWNNKALKEEKLSILTAEAPNAINALIDYLFDLYGYVLSVFFNIIALSIVVEPLFSVAYGISVLAVLMVMNIKRRQQRHLTKKALAARVDLTQSLLAAWDNVLLGNNYNYTLWEDKTSQRLKRTLQRNVDLERFDQIMAIFISLMTSIPSLLVVIHYAIKNQHDQVALTTFLVTLPILFMILSYTYQTLTLAFRWGMHKSKLVSLYKTIQAKTDQAIELEKKVKWDKIRLMTETVTPDTNVSLAFPQELNSHQDILKQIESQGRLTIRGENGSGKSTLLMLVKQALKNRAFLLPTFNQLSFESEMNKFSTGEALKNKLLEIFQKVDTDVLLLDEWDANLDPENRKLLSQLIHDISKQKCVIEVRHR